VDKLSISTIAGSIDISVIPDLKYPYRNGSLRTEAIAGSTTLFLLSPLRHRDHIDATHTAKAGSINLFYPLEWEGVVDARATAGSIMMKGEGLRIIDDRGTMPRFVRGVKGEEWPGKGDVKIFGEAGSLSFTLVESKVS